MVNDLDDPICRHWFRMSGGDPNNPIDPWGVLIGFITSTNPTVFTHYLAGGLYVIEVAYSSSDPSYDEKVETMLEAVDTCVKTLIDSNGCMLTAVGFNGWNSASVIREILTHRDAIEAE